MEDCIGCTFLENRKSCSKGHKIIIKKKNNVLTIETSNTGCFEMGGRIF